MRVFLGIDSKYFILHSIFDLNLSKFGFSLSKFTAKSDNLQFRSRLPVIFVQIGEKFVSSREKKIVKKREEKKKENGYEKEKNGYIT